MIKRIKIDLLMFTNSFLTVQDIADEAAVRLRANEVMTALVSRNFDSKIADKGDTVQIKVPNTFSANDFSTTITAQDITEGKRLLTFDTIKDVSVDITSKEKTLNINDFSEQVINPAMEALAAKVDVDLIEKYKEIPYFTGASGSTPDALSDFANASKILNGNKAPVNGEKAGVWDEEAIAKFQILDALVGADKSGTTETLRMGELGRVFNINNYLDQNVALHTAGLYSALEDAKAVVTVANNGVIAATNTPYSAMVLTSTAGASTATLLKGDLIVQETNQYTVLEDTAAAASGVVTAKVYPALAANLASTAVTFPDVSAKAHTANLVFAKKAFVLGVRPMSTDVAGVESAVASIDGLSVRVTRGYSMSTKTETISFDILYGILTLQPELACRVLG